MLSDYEMQRQRNMVANSEALAAMGLAKPVRPSAAPRRPAAAARPKQRERVSLRAAGLGPDSENLEAALVAAEEARKKRAAERASAEAEAFRANKTSKRSYADEALTAEQRSALAAADDGWLAEFETFYHGHLSINNFSAVMRHIRPLVAGAGVDFGTTGSFLVGRPLSLASDVAAIKEELRSEANAVFRLDMEKGGWYLNHPLNKLLDFQSHKLGLEPRRTVARAAAPPPPPQRAGDGPGAGWGAHAPMPVGRRVEVRMHDEGLVGSMFAGVVVPPPGGKGEAPMLPDSADGPRPLTHTQADGGARPAEGVQARANGSEGGGHPVGGVAPNAGAAGGVSAGGGGSAWVQFDHLLDDDEITPLCEEHLLRNVRLAPPPTPADFYRGVAVNDIVELLFEDAWWEVVVTSVQGGASGRSGPAGAGEEGRLGAGGPSGGDGPGEGKVGPAPPFLFAVRSLDYDAAHSLVEEHRIRPSWRWSAADYTWRFGGTGGSQARVPLGNEGP